MVLTRIWFWGASGIAVAIFWATGTVIFKQPMQTKGFLWTGWQLMRYICSCVLHSFSPSLSRHAAWGLTQSEWKEEWDGIQITISAVNSSKLFFLYGWKNWCPKSGKSWSCRIWKTSATTTEGDRKGFFFHLAFWYSPAHLPSPPVSRSTALCAAVPN